MKKKEYLINAIQIIDIEGDTYIPSVVYYDKNGKSLIGSLAIAEAINKKENPLISNFKIDLGNIDPNSSSPRTKIDVGLTEPKTPALIQYRRQFKM